MKKVSEKRPRGRPATGRDPVTAIRLSPDLLAAIDKQVAATSAESRAAAIREILVRFLKKKGML
jgi:hypothetical protein